MDIAANGPPPQPAASPAAGKPAGAAAAPAANAAAAAPGGAAPAAGAATPAGDPPLHLSLDKIRANIHRIGNAAVQRALLAAIDTASGDLDRVRENIEAWYNSAMDRIAGWYRRSTHWVIFLIAIAITVGLNINTLTVADYLYSHASVRNAISAAEEHALASSDQTTVYQTAQQELMDLHLPIGWSHSAATPQITTSTAAPHFSLAGFNLLEEVRSFVALVITAPWRDFFQPLIGWAITAFAATLGAPFWFDVLNRVMTARSTIKSQ